MKPLLVFDIQRFSTHDGTGIRTNVFFKGCPLQCKWCSNPESRSFYPELIYDEKRCKNFQDCVDISGGSITVTGNQLVIDRKSLKNPDSYRSVCPSKAITVTGKYMSVEELLQEILRDFPFYSEENGGVTFTGGEPFFQEVEIFDLAAEIKKKNINLAVETTLNVPWKKLAGHTGLFDVFLVDIKHTDAEKFRNYTGGNLEQVVANIKMLIKTGAKIVARVPVIPGFNFSEPEMISIIDFVSSFSEIQELNFIPYHTLGSRKYELLGKIYDYGGYKNLLPGDVEPYLRYAENKGLNVNIGG